MDLPPAAKREILANAALELGMLPEALEKDIWICHVLGVLFSISGLPLIVFRGGTSLSKAFNAIDRFSEDIDLTISHEDILPETSNFFDFSSNKRNNLLDSLSALLVEILREKIYPLLSEALGIYGKIAFDEQEKMTISFFYNSILDVPVNSYINKKVMLEFGGRGGIEPNSVIKISPYAARLHPELQFPEPSARVVSGTRTFWDKVTLIHSEISRFNHRYRDQGLCRVDRNRTLAGDPGLGAGLTSRIPSSPHRRKPRSNLPHSG
jgi:hypothetical protein